MALFKCPDCGNTVSTTADCCPHCGMIFTVCPECGKVYKGELSQCPSCGAKMPKKGGEAAPVQVPPPMQTTPPVQAPQSEKQGADNIQADYSSTKLIDIWKSKQEQKANTANLLNYIRIGCGIVCIIPLVIAVIKFIGWASQDASLEKFAEMNDVYDGIVVLLWLYVAASVIYELVMSFKNYYICTNIIMWIRAGHFNGVKYFSKYVKPNAQDQFGDLGFKSDSSDEVVWYYLSKNPEKINSIYLSLIVRFIVNVYGEIAFALFVIDFCKQYFTSQFLGLELEYDWTLFVILVSILIVLKVLSAIICGQPERKGKAMVMKELKDGGAVRYSSLLDSE